MTSQREREGKRAHESKSGARRRGEKKWGKGKGGKSGRKGEREESLLEVEKPIITLIQLRPVFHT